MIPLASMSWDEAPADGVAADQFLDLSGCTLGGQSFTSDTMVLLASGRAVLTVTTVSFSYEQRSQRPRGGKFVLAGVGG